MSEVKEEQQQKKLEGFEFWEKKLNKCQYVVAPMVDQSELAWRMLSRRYGAQLCYTPMFHSAVFIRDPQYRRDALQTCKQDRPLIIQFCSNDPDTLLAAGKLAEGNCDAIDLNLGCPQAIARRGHYGAYLQDEWELLGKMVSLCHRELKVPITCKIRVLENIHRTVKYARMLEKAGCQLLTVHGRSRDMKGRETGLADWKYVKAIKKAVNIPVFSNGNIQYLSDVKQCIEETGVEGVMTAEGNLHNPALFSGTSPPVWQMCEEYFDLVDKYPCPLGYIRGHVFKILHHALHLHHDVRDRVGGANSFQDIKEAVLTLKERCLKEMDDENFDPRKGLYGELPLPYWYCQPYERPNPAEALVNRGKREILKRPLAIEALVEEKGLSKKKVKKRLRNPNKNFDKERVLFEICEDTNCPNPRGQKCSYNLCKGCCRKMTSEKIVDCPGHKIIFTTHPALEDRKEDVKPSADTPSVAIATESTKASTDSDSVDTNSTDTPSVAIATETAKVSSDSDSVDTNSTDTPSVVIETETAKISPGSNSVDTNSNDTPSVVIATELTKGSTKSDSVDTNSNDTHSAPDKCSESKGTENGISEMRLENNICN